MTSVQFMLSRIPHRTTAPAVASIGAPDDAVADDIYSFWSFDNIDETLYDGNPCVCIGSIRMQMSSSDDWTVQTLATTDGIGQFNEQTWFNFPDSQNGCASGTFIISNAGTEPVWTTQNYYYRVNRNGDCDFLVNFVNVSTPGVGANNAVIALPSQMDTNGLSTSMINAQCLLRDAAADYAGVPLTQSSGTSFLIFDTVGTMAGSANTPMQNQDWDTNEDLDITGTYRILDA
jgi:hypothetical protein